MRIIFCLLFVNIYLNVESQLKLKLSYRESYSELFTTIFDTGKIDSIQLENFNLLPYNSDHSIIQNVTVDSNMVVKSLKRFYKDKTLAFDAIVFSYTKLGNIDFPNVIIQTFYKNGKFRSKEVYMYVNDKWFEQSYFFDELENVIGEKSVINCDTISGIFLTKVVNETKYIYNVYKDNKRIFEIFLNPCIGSEYISIFKIYDIVNNVELQNKRQIKQFLKKMNYSHFICMFENLFLMDNSNIYFPQ